MEMNPDRPNWLLYGLILVSAALHILVIAGASGWFESEEVSYIELSLHEYRKPPGRTIPRPPVRRDQEPVWDRTEPARIQSRPIPRPSSPKPVRPAPETAPEFPDLEKSEIMAWKPPPADEPVAAQETVAVKDSGKNSGEASGVNESNAQDYFSMVRMRIESKKRYPHSAVRRRIQGTVVVRFVIGGRGEVEDIHIVEESQHRLLNEAALDAIRDSSPFPVPPRPIFDGPVAMEIGIVFELS